MPQVSVLPAFTSALLSALQARPALWGVTVAPFWPGPNATAEMITLDAEVRGQMVIPTLKAGRKQRQETFEVDLVVWVFSTGSAIGSAATVDARAFELMAEVDNVLADDPTVGAVVQWAAIRDYGRLLAPFQKGFAVELHTTVEGHARLT